jgi:hypothetical protein
MSGNSFLIFTSYTIRKFHSITTTKMSVLLIGEHPVTGVMYLLFGMCSPVELSTAVLNLDSSSWTAGNPNSYHSQGDLPHI